MSTTRIPRADGKETRRVLKTVAQRLFAMHGVGGVSIRDIVVAAGQRNNASLHYHFGSKEALIGELLIDGARLIDANRQALLDAIEASGEPATVRAVLEALVQPVNRMTEDVERGNTYIRFIADLQLNHRTFFRATLGSRWNAGYRRCVKMLRELLVAIPAPLLEQRISMMGIYANAIFAAKEAAMDEGRAPNRFWTPVHTLENIIDTLQAVLESAPSTTTLTLLDTDDSRATARPAGFRAA